MPWNDSPVIKDIYHCTAVSMNTLLHTWILFKQLTLKTDAVHRMGYNHISTQSGVDMYEIIVELYNKHCNFWMARRSRLYRKLQWNFTVYAIDLTHWRREKWPSFPRCIFLKEIVWLAIEISLKFVSKVQINDIPALVRMMAGRRSCDKRLSEPMMPWFTDAYMRHSASTG